MSKRKPPTRHVTKKPVKKPVQKEQGQTEQEKEQDIHDIEILDAEKDAEKPVIKHPANHLVNN